VPDSSKQDCGYFGIDESDCVGSGCCWQESSSGAPWCFNRAQAAASFIHNAGKKEAVKQKLEAEAASKVKAASLFQADTAATFKFKSEQEAIATFKFKAEQETIARTALKKKLEAEMVSKLKDKGIASLVEADSAATHKLKAEQEAAKQAAKQKLEAEVAAKTLFQAKEEAAARELHMQKLEAEVKRRMAA